jgi:short-subunit dehydrogenase
MSHIQGRSVLITGGASGIGRIMAGMVVERKARSLILWDINARELDAAVGELKSVHPQVHGRTVNVADLEDVVRASREAQDAAGGVDILINNAGIVVGRYFHEHTHSDIDRTLSINTLAPMHITLEFLPQMLQRGSGHIVNIASAAGMVANPRMSAYCASKWGVIGWSDSLRLELERLNPGVRVTTVTPYYIDTGMFAGVRSLIPIVKPRVAAQRIVRGIEKDKLFVRMPFIVNLLPFVRGILPLRCFDFIVGRVLRVYSTMNEFKGRSTD